MCSLELVASIRLSSDKGTAPPLSPLTRGSLPLVSLSSRYRALCPGWLLCRASFCRGPCASYQRRGNQPHSILFFFFPESTFERGTAVHSYEKIQRSLRVLADALLDSTFVSPRHSSLPSERTDRWLSHIRIHSIHRFNPSNFAQSDLRPTQFLRRFLSMKPSLMKLYYLLLKSRTVKYNILNAVNMFMKLIGGPVLATAIDTKTFSSQRKYSIR